MMERAAVAIRTIATAPTDESDVTATLGTLQQTREQIAPWADDKPGTPQAGPAKRPLDLLKSSPRCRKQFIGVDPKMRCVERCPFRFRTRPVDSLACTGYAQLAFCVPDGLADVFTIQQDMTNGRNAP